MLDASTWRGGDHGTKLVEGGFVVYNCLTWMKAKRVVACTSPVELTKFPYLQVKNITYCKYKFLSLVSFIESHY